MFGFGFGSELDLSQFDTQVDFALPGGGSAVQIGGVAGGGGQIGLTLPGGINVQLGFTPGRGGPDPRRQATEIVNAAERAMQENLAQFHANSVSPADARSRYDQLYAWMVDNLRRVPDTAVSNRSIQERAPGGIYDYKRAYRDPIPDGLFGSSSSGAGATASAGGDIIRQITQGGVVTWIVVGLVAWFVLKKVL